MQRASDGPQGRHRRASLRKLDVESQITIAVVGVLLALVVVRLGGSLLGLQVFGGLDRLQAFAPWNDGTPTTAVNPYIGDTIDALMPAYIEAHDRFWSGDFPWWSNLAGAGSPLLSSVVIGAGTPLSIWLILLPTQWALGFVKLLQLIVAFGGMVLWLRRVGAAPWAASLAGLLYCGSGFFVSWSNWVPQTTTAALLPALFWTTERLVQERRLLSALPVSVVTASVLLAGFPAAAGHGLYAAGIYFVVRMVAEGRSITRGETLRTILYGVGAVILGVTIAAFQLATLAGQLSDADLGYRANSFDGYLSLHSFLSTILPRPFTSIGYPRSNPIESFAYLGAGTVLLAVLAVMTARYVRPRRGVVTFLVVGTLLSAALAWRHGWWTDWLADVPVFAQNFSGRLRDLVGLFVCALAGLGCTALLATVRNRSQARSRAAAVTVVGATLIAALGVLLLAFGNRPSARSQVVWDVALGCLTVVLIITCGLTWRRRRVAVAAMAVAAIIAGIQIIVNTAFYWPVSDPDDFFQTNGLISSAEEHVGHDRTLQVGSFLGSTSGAYGLRTVTGHSFQPPPWRQYLTAVDQNAYSAGGTSPTNPIISTDLTSATVGRALLDRLGVKWIIASPGQPIPGTVRMIDGSAATKDPPGPGRKILAAGESVRLPMKSVPVRAVQVQVTEPVARGTVAALAIRILDAGGATLGTGTLRSSGAPAGWLTVPVAGETVTAGGGPLTLEITNAGVSLVLVANNAPVTARVVVPVDDGLRLTYADNHGTLWERLHSLDRIRWAGRTTVIPDGKQRLQRLDDPALPPDVVVLDQQGPTAGGQPAALRVAADSGDRIVVDVDAQAAGYLVVADYMLSGWTATVDDQPTSILSADHALSAVAVGQGKHRVEFRWVGKYLGVGKAVSLTGGAVFLLLLGGGLLHRRRAAGQRDAGADTEGFPSADTQMDAPSGQRGSVPAEHPGPHLGS